VGRGKLVGEPISILFDKFKFKYDILRLSTPIEEREKMLSEADLIISGAGDPRIIKKEMIKDGVFLIDAGTSSAKKKLIGDIDLACLEKASYFSKTPGGVGPITTAVIFDNLKKILKK
jgi:methylenetetrahydrofolate dehydrogenase (NADP+)/methenyltetrahydrofolate cyclohydrolase